ncbi:hypothetical protein SSX86_006277 [Deinandra increscens subsp. villosa]|uniref:RING-type E3 ubiquitin transferase n=1 Tax=Deinandra increscens subsp. villosa TaxID=3103831 RepID=A0AAP0DIJ7_9ASTR
MGDYLNLPKPQNQLLSTQSSPPPPPPQHRSNMSILYYGLVIVATAAIVLAIYNLIIVRWCATQYHNSRENNHLSHHRRNNIMPSQPPSAPSRGSSTVGLTSSFRYKKGTNQELHKIECSVCLSVFEEGEEVRKLPRCNHSFHALCIDMWLYSHFDCPLCRAVVVEPLLRVATPPQHRHTESGLSEHSRDGLLDRGSPST